MEKWLGRNSKFSDNVYRPIYVTYIKKYDIYLSDDIDTLYADTSKVAEGVECTNSTGVNVAINKKLSEAKKLDIGDIININGQELIVDDIFNDDINSSSGITPDANSG